VKAAAITGIGGPDVVSVVDVDDPIARPGELVVQVEATSYNHIDALLRTEDFGNPFPLVPGSDVVGRVVGGEDDATKGKVMVNPGIPCGACDMCSRQSTCRYVRILGVHRSGGYGEFVSVPAAQCFRLPDSVDVDKAAAFPLVFLTAWRMLRTRARLAPGESVLIWGASGGLGSAAAAITRLLGGRTIAVVRHSEHVEALQRYAADFVIDSSTTDVLAAVMELTDGAGVDVVFEGPGNPTFATSIQAVSQGGRIVTAAASGGKQVEMNVEDLYYRQISVLGSRMGYRHEFVEILNHFLAGRIAPLVSTVLPLSQARSAHQMAANGNRCGKMVLRNDL